MSTVSRFLLSKRFVVLWSIAIGVYIYAWATKGTFDPRTIGAYWPGHFFAAQADAMLHGRLWIDRSNLPGECYFTDGKCYGYYGIVPSIARLPLVPLLGVKNSEMTAVFLAIAAGVANWGALDLCRRVLARESPDGGSAAAGSMALAAVVLGPGSVLLLLTDAYVYHESILWAVAATMVGANLFWRWWTDRRPRQFIGATVAFTIAAGSRPTAMFVALVLAVGLVIVEARAHRLNRRIVLGAAAMGLLPILLVTLVFYAKFGSPTPNDDNYEGLSYVFVQYMVSNNGRWQQFSPSYMPTGLLAYFAPDALRFSTDWPWIRFRFGRPFGNWPLERIAYLWPQPKDSQNAESIVSITDAMPLALIATVSSAVSIFRRRRNRYELLLLAALATCVVTLVTHWSISSRYLGDFYPLLAAGTAFAATFVPRYARLGRGARIVIATSVWALAIASVVIVSFLAPQYNWTYRFGIQ